jgi:hypothetical protein
MQRLWEPAGGTLGMGLVTVIFMNIVDYLLGLPVQSQFRKCWLTQFFLAAVSRKGIWVSVFAVYLCALRP